MVDFVEDAAQNDHNHVKATFEMEKKQPAEPVE
jgi:hypothetical protein